MTFIDSLIACSTQDDLNTLLANSNRNTIIDSLLVYSNQFDNPEYLGQLSFNSDRTKYLIKQVSSFPCCDQSKYFLMSLIGDPELHWRCSNMILPSLYWYYRSFAPKNTTISKVNAIGLSLSQDYSVPYERDYLYSVDSINLPTDILSPSYLAFLSLLPKINKFFDYITKNESEKDKFLKPYKLFGIARNKLGWHTDNKAHNDTNIRVIVFSK